MGHLAGKDIYRKLGKKIDGLTMRAPWTETFRTILRELYTEEEADVIVRMPYGLSSFNRIKAVTGYDEAQLRKTLDNLAFKGLVMDLQLRRDYYYTISPMMIGIFEFTMMRTDRNIDSKKIAGLFHDYVLKDRSFFAANAGHGSKIALMRALPHEEAIPPAEHVEVLDYEKARIIIENNRKFAISLCSCRHEKHHVGVKQCDVPLETCSTFGFGTNYFIRRNLGKEVSRSEMLENLARSKEMGLVLSADNVQFGVSFMCHCCKCCCSILQGINRFGYPNLIMTSSFISKCNEEICTGCGKCAKACPIDAIRMVSFEASEGKKRKRPEIDRSICLGCGVCFLKCVNGSMRLVKREQRVIPPETTFERIILQCLEHGTLQNFIFNNPQSMGHKFMRGFVGAFLKLPPVKKSLMSDSLRSRFLSAMKKAI